VPEKYSPIADYGLIGDAQSTALVRLGPGGPGIEGSMELPLLLIIIGIVVAILVNYAIGIVCILVGLVLLIWPRLRASRTRV
jgi:hypothetical protein